MTKFNEMIYQNRTTYKILALGEFDNYEYKIVSMGTHPCAYVKLPADNIYYRHSYRNIPIYVHGGLTYSKKEKDGFWIGWDYAHCGDYTWWGSDKNDKKWTVDEIFEDVKNAISQLKQINNKSNRG